MADARVLCSLAMTALTHPVSSPAPESVKPCISQAAIAILADLHSNGVRLLAYKSAELFALGLAGKGDIDLLVHPADIERMRRVFRTNAGFRGIVSRWHDNSVAEREDWFLPITGARFLHFDIAQAIMAGPKFAKFMRVSEFDQIAAGEAGSSPSGVLVAGPLARASIGLVRAACAGSRREQAKHLLMDPCVADMLRQRPADPAAILTIPVLVAQTRCEVGVRVEGNTLLLAPGALLRLRRAIETACGTGIAERWRHNLIHPGRKLTAGLLRRLPRGIVNHPLDRLKLPNGAIVALVGPDGVGKSTQAAMRQAAFAHRFLTARIYLGSNDGGWMAWRRKLRRRPGKGAPTAKIARDKPASVADRTWLHATGSACWRLVVGLRRLLLIRRAERLARRGVLVITDRWPQDLAEGMLDGPSSPPAEHFRLARALWRAEKRLYRLMREHRPTFTVHLEAPFEVSHERKPGDIDRPDFERRVHFMRMLREGTEGIAVVDASMPLEKVGESLFRLTCQHLSEA